MNFIQDDKSQITLRYITYLMYGTLNGYYYQLVIGISFSLSQSDPIEQVLLLYVFIVFTAHLYVDSPK
jgi:hypothetical protein